MKQVSHFILNLGHWPSIFNMVDKSHQCLQCEYKSTAKSKLHIHIRSVHEGQKFQCPHCQHKATYRGNLQRHIKSVHEGQRFPCQQCDCKATQKRSLQTH